jgi:hypothetical protein
MNDEELREIAYADRTGLDLAIRWDPEELYKILQRANKLTLPQLHELLKKLVSNFQRKRFVRITSLPSMKRIA